MLYISTGLLFMLLPGTFLGVWNLLAISGHYAADFVSAAWIQAHSGKVGHAEIKIGDSVIMLADEYPEMGYKSPQSLGGSPVSILLYFEDVDAVFKRALAAGAKETIPVKVSNRGSWASYRGTKVVVPCASLQYFMTLAVQFKSL